MSELPVFFPSTPAPAEEIYVADLRGYCEHTQFLLHVLQGLINRKQPQIFLVNRPAQDHHDLERVWDLSTDIWLDLLRERGHQLRFVENPLELLSIFRSEVRGAVVYSKQAWGRYSLGVEPHVQNLALMLCAQLDALPVCEADNRLLKLPVLDDMRGRWSSPVEAYAWAEEHLWAQCHPRLIATLPLPLFRPMDYLVAHKVFTTHLSNPPEADHPEELEQFRHLLTLTPANTPVFGVWDLFRSAEHIEASYDFERAFIDCVSEMGHFFVVTHECGNLTVHAGLGPFDRVSPPAEPIPLDPALCYLSFIFSEGDNISWQMLNRPLLWNDPNRGKVPIGWSTAVVLPQLCPDIMDYYHRTATPADCTVAATSGLGYAFPYRYGRRLGTERDGCLAGFLELTDAGMRHLGCRTACVLDHSDSDYLTPRDTLEAFARQVPQARGLFSGYPCLFDQGVVPDRPQERIGNLAVLHVEHRTVGVDIAEEILRLAAQKERPAFLYVFVSGWADTPTTILRLVERLGDGFRVVRPDQLAELFLAAHPRQSPSGRLAEWGER